MVTARDLTSPMRELDNLLHNHGPLAASSRMLEIFEREKLSPFERRALHMMLISSLHLLVHPNSRH